MGCTFRARLNHLASIWYTVLIVALQAYLLYLGFERYRLYNDIKWPTNGHPHLWLTVYIILYAACIPMSLLFFAFGFFKSGNIAGDNERLADREERIIEVSRNRHGEKKGCVHGLKVLWQHLPPLPQQIHVVMALAQLVAQQLMIAQLYRHGFVNSGDFLNSELDFLYQRTRQLVMNLPIGESRLQGFRITADELASLPVSPNLLPLLMHLKLFGIPLEFVNLFIALIAFAIVYPSVFWRVSKPFSLLFTLHLFIYGAQIMFGYISFSILFRIQETNMKSQRSIGLGQYLAPIKPLNFPIYHPLFILGFFILRFVATTIAPTAMYAYGYNKYFLNLLSVQQRNVSKSNQNDHEYQRRFNRSPEGDICCDGYLPHMNAIMLLIIVAAAVGPTIYALLIIFQHEEKPLLLTCIIVDVIYLFTWILVWLGLTLKRDWDFNVVHKVHQFYGLQKGMATGAIKGNENPSQLKNSVLVMHKDHMYVTDDQLAKQSLLRAIQLGKFENIGQPDDQQYWKHQQQSPSARRILMDDSVKNSPEMKRLLRNPSEDNSQSVSYSTTRQGITSSQIIARGNSTPPENNGFGTIQRNQQYAGIGTLNRNHQGTMQRSVNVPQSWQANSQESYASIHKQQKDPSMYQRRGSNENNTYGQIESAYGNYGTYARVPQVSRIQVPPQAQYSQQNVIRRPQDSSNQQLNSMRQSPLLSERSSLNGASSIPPRDQSQYQKGGVKLSSFNNTDGKQRNGIYGQGAWGSSQRVNPGQPNQLLWGSQSSQQKLTNGVPSDEQCFTPTSTLTSQESNCTPTPGSPTSANPLYSRMNGGAASSMYGTVGDDYQDRTLLKNNPIRTTTVSTATLSLRHAVKPESRIDDSANFSMGSPASGSDSTRAPTSTHSTHNDFATSIV